jgi:hypothetical protein
MSGCWSAARSGVCRAALIGPPVHVWRQSPRRLQWAGEFRPQPVTTARRNGMERSKVGQQGPLISGSCSLIRGGRTPAWSPPAGAGVPVKRS